MGQIRAESILKKITSISVLLVILLLGILIYLVRESDGGSSGKTVLQVHCAAGMRKPVEEAVAVYAKKHDIDIQINYGGSGQLYAMLQTTGGDIYIPADDSYIKQAQRQGIINDYQVLSRLTAGLLVQRGNPKNIVSLDDLERKHIRVCVAEPSAAIGKYTEEIVTQEGVTIAHANRVLTVNEVASHVSLGSADVGVVWDAVAQQYPNCEFIRVDSFQQSANRSCVGVLKTSVNAEQARALAHFLATDAKAIFYKHGYDTREEDTEKQTE